MRSTIEYTSMGFGTFRNRSGKPAGRALAVAASVGAAAVTAAFAARATAANYTLTGSDAGGTSSFNAAGQFNSGAAPAAGNTYNTGSFTLRSNNSGGTYTFAGDSLTIDAGGRLLGKAPAANASNPALTTVTLVTNNLILNGGLIDEAGNGGDNAVLALQGTLTVNAASLLGAAGGEFLNVGSTLNGSAGLTIGGASANGGGDTGTVVLAGSIANYTGVFNLGGGTLAFNQSASTTLANAVTGTGALSQQANNTLTLGTADTVGNLFVRAGAVTVTSTLTASSYSSIGQVAGDNGTLNIGPGTAFTGGDFNIADVSSSATAADVGTVNVSGGSLSVVTLYVGKGSASTAAGNNATGTVNFSAGTLNASNGLRVGAYGTGTLNQTGGATTVTGGFTSMGLNAGSNGTYNLTGGSFTNNATRDINVGDSGTGTLNIGGTGSFNASLGTFYIARQAVAVGTVNLNAGGTLTIPAIAAGGGTAAFNFNGGTLVASASSTTFTAGAGTISVLAGGAVFNTSGFSDTIGRNVASGTAAADGGLTKLGAGTLSLSGTDAYTGPTVVSAGTLSVGAGGATGSISNTSSISVAIGALLADNLTTASTLPVPITGAGGFVQLGTGTTTALANNTYTGSTNVAAGTLSVSAILNGGLTSPVGASTNDPSNLILAGGQLLYTGATATTDRGFTLAGTGTSYLNVSAAAATLTFGGQIVSPGTATTFIKLGGGTVAFTNAASTNTFATATGGNGLFIVDGGVLFPAATNALSAGTFRIGNNGPAGGLTAQTTAAFATLAGGTNTIGGSLLMSNNNGPAQATTLNLNGGTLTVGDVIGLGGGTAGNNGPATLNLSGGAAFIGARNFRLSEQSGTDTVNLTGTGTSLTLNGTTANGDAFAVGDGVAANASVGVVNQAGGTSVTLAAIPLYVGGEPGSTTRNGTGTYNLGDGTATAATLTAPMVQGGAGTGTVNFNNGALVANANGTTFLSGLTAANVLAGGVTINTAAFNVTAGQALLASTTSTGGGLTKTGTGTLTLTGASTYAGNTAVTAGTLRVNGSTLATGTVLIPAAGTLGGNGSVGAVTVAGTITAGPDAATVGNLSTGVQTWNASGAYVAKLTGDTTANDRLILSGLTVAATSANRFTVNVTGTNASSATQASYVLAVDTAATSGDPFKLGALTLQVNGTTPPSSYALAERTDTTGAGGYDLILSTAAAPEPTSLLLLAAAGGPLVLGRRRRAARR